MYVDESGFDSRENFRDKCYAMIGKIVIGKVPGKRPKRISLIAGYSNGKLVAPATFEGTCSKDLCLGWIDQILLKNLPPKQIIIMDNASIHKSKELRELIEKEGHFLLFLPPYSPDFNPIEKIFGVIKRLLKGASTGTTLDDIIVSHF